MERESDGSPILVGRILTGGEIALPIPLDPPDDCGCVWATFGEMMHGPGLPPSPSDVANPGASSTEYGVLERTHESDPNALRRIDFIFAPCEAHGRSAVLDARRRAMEEGERT